ncbi:MAG: hypothetical protein JNG88_16385 [Phycisphaerales bacterium]|nr:hypothetical protein [Phycisphaerales bacterium]
MNNKPENATREQLYDEVWETPMRHLAIKYGLSDVGLAKLLIRLNVPRPPVGYWAKRSAGKAPAKPPLPAIDAPMSVDDPKRLGGAPSTHPLIR